MKKLIWLLGLILAVNSGAVVIQGESSPGVYTNVAVDGSGNLSTAGTLTVTEPAQGSTTSGQTGGLVQGAVTTSVPSYTTGKTNPLSLTTTGALRVDGSTAIQPVSGTVSTNSNLATIGGVTVVVGTGTGAANTGVQRVAVSSDSFPSSQAVTGTFYQATQPVSAASLPLPSGASTAAKQPALGTAGTASADVISVQGIASMTALKTDSSATTQPISDAYSITQTAVTVTGTSGQLIASNASRKYLSWMVVGTSDVTCVPGASAAVFGAGFVYQSSGANRQGASQEFPHGAPTNAFQCIGASTGSIIYVFEGV